RVMIKLRITCNTTSTNPYNDAQQINNLKVPFSSYFRCQFQDQSGNNFYLYGSNFGTGLPWQKNPPNPYYCGMFYNTSILFGLYQCIMGGNPPQVYNYSTMVNTLTALVKANNTPGAYFDIVFLIDNSFTQGFNGSVTPFSTAPAPYKFDLWMYPAVFVTGASSGSNFSTTNFSVTLQDYAINAIDIEYKDSAESTVSFNSFYSTSDITNRWGEKTVNVYYGDTLTPGYPGAFRLANSSPTASWHPRGFNYLFDSGTSNADPGSGKYRFNNSPLSSI